MRWIQFILVFSLIFQFHSAEILADNSEPVDFTEYRKWAEDSKFQKAFDELKSVPDNKFPYNQLHLKYFALGYWAFSLKKWSESRDLLNNAMKFGQTNAAHIYFLIGHSFKEEGQYKKAESYFDRALDYRPPQNIVFQTRFELSEIAVLTNSSRKALAHLKYLERRWRGTPNYPEVLWRLIGVELKENRKHLACRWARKIYSDHPTHPLVASWGVNLQENKFGVQALGCVSSRKDTERRMRRLSLSGWSDEARKEIEQLRSTSSPKDLMAYDLMLARLLESQGFPSDALKILQKYYEASKYSYGFLNLYAKVAARANEYAAAIGAYYSAYKLSPKSKNGKEALFTAAFLSYQVQDYDGAYRKFSELNGKFQGSGLARDSRWHLAWLKYLKNDFPGAEKSFRALLSESYKVRRRRVVHPFANERTKYWLAMSLLKQEKFNEAREILTPLAEDKGLGYYALVAKTRLVQIAKPGEARTVASLSEKDSASTTSSELEVSEPKALPNMLYSTGKEDKPEEASEDSEESLQTLSSENDSIESDRSSEETGPKFEAAKSESETDAKECSDIEPPSTFKNPQLQNRFQSANNLIDIGLKDWARWELFEIERRTSNKTYLKMLMDTYTKISSYNRAAYIAEIDFARDRYQSGLKDGRQIWAFAFPKAFESTVETFSDKYSVPASLIYSIMRAESQFNKDALSPVGARGLMQLMPFTAQQLAKLLGEPSVSEADLHKAEINLRLGSRYLARLQKKFGDQVPLIAAGYNAGPHRVNNWLTSFGRLEMDEFIEHVPFVETRNYMKKVARNFALYQFLYNEKQAKLAWLTAPVSFDGKLTHVSRESWESLD